MEQEPLSQRAARTGKAETPQPGRSGFQRWTTTAAPLFIPRTCKCRLWEGKESGAEVPAGGRTPAVRVPVTRTPRRLQAAPCTDFAAADSHSP